MQAALDVEPGLDRARMADCQAAGSLPPAGATPISSVVGSQASASSSEATTGTSESSPRDVVADARAGAGGIDHRDRGPSP